jgi:cytochrome c peroxidase
MVFRGWLLGRTRVALALALAALGVCAGGCAQPSEDLPSVRLESMGLDLDEPLCPLPAAPDVDEGWAALGAQLFQDPALSGDQKVACSDCHHGDHGLADETPLSTAEGRKATLVNAPTMYNTVYLFRITWGGRYESLEAHLDDLIENPDVMASTWEVASQHLQNKPGYPERFRAVFADGLKPANVRAALIEYERSLVTPNAPFDHYLLGEEDAISAEAKRGYSLFKTYGCASCHQGCGVGGNMLERLGVLREYFPKRGLRPGDDGLYTKTQLERDRHVFRVPSLRNVARTAPYFHDGSATSLDEAIRVMGAVQLGRELDPEDRRFIAAFLESLTGRYRGKPI